MPMVSGASCASSTYLSKSLFSGPMLASVGLLRDDPVEPPPPLL